jgi:DNA-binding NarL/FixJ family response regulator
VPPRRAEVTRSTGLSVLLAEPQALIADALRMALQIEPHIARVDAVRTGRDAIGEAARTNPDVVLVDAAVEDPDVVEVTSLIKTARPDAHLIVYAGYEDDVERLVSLFHAGADAYLTKSDELIDLVNATRSVQSGKVLLPLTVLRAALGHDPLLQGDPYRRLARLSLREKDILILLCDGQAGDEIAETLFISRHTVKTHINRVMKKLGVHSRAEARDLVARHGLLGYLRQSVPPPLP